MENIADFLQLYQNLGVAGFVAAVLFSLAMVGLYEVLRIFIRRVLDRYFNRIFKTKKNPLKSSFFNKMDILIYYKAPRFQVRCPLRKKIFTKLLQIYFQTWKDRAQEKATDPALDRMNAEEYTAFWSNFVYKTMDLSEERALREGVPPLAVEKFREYLITTMRLILTTAEQVCVSIKVYESNTEKTIAILDFLAILLDIALIDAEKAVMAINGDLSKVEYAGVRCGQCEEGCEYRAISNKSGDDL